MSIKKRKQARQMVKRARKVKRAKKVEEVVKIRSKNWWPRERQSSRRILDLLEFHSHVHPLNNGRLG
jgi:hypothetical protein